MTRVQRYYVSEDGKPEREVDVREYVMHESRAGFNGPGHFADPPYPACASFGATKGGRTVRGRTEPLR